MCAFTNILSVPAYYCLWSPATVESCVHKKTYDVYCRCGEPHIAIGASFWTHKPVVALDFRQVINAIVLTIMPHKEYVIPECNSVLFTTALERAKSNILVISDCKQGTPNFPCDSDGNLLARCANARFPKLLPLFRNKTSKIVVVNNVTRLKSNKPSDDPRIEYLNSAIDDIHKYKGKPFSVVMYDHLECNDLYILQQVGNDSHKEQRIKKLTQFYKLIPNLIRIGMLTPDSLIFIPNIKTEKFVEARLMMDGIESICDIGYLSGPCNPLYEATVKYMDDVKAKVSSLNHLDLNKAAYIRFGVDETHPFIVARPLSQSERDGNFRSVNRAISVDVTKPQR